MEKKNPIIAIGSLVPGLVNTVLSLVRDKKKNNDKDTDLNLINQGTEFIHENIGKGVSISSKRVMNIGISSALILHGISTGDIMVIGLGVIYSLGMSYITFLTEKLPKN